jgi:hypothetical protein
VADPDEVHPQAGGGHAEGRGNYTKEVAELQYKSVL